MNDGQTFRTADGNLSFEQLGELVSSIWAEGHPDIHMYPSGTQTDDVTYPNLTWGCAGKWLKDALKPRVIDEFVSDDGRPHTKSMVQYRCLLEVKVAARDPKSANTLIHEFELFMLEFVGALKRAGIAEVLYAQRMPDSEDNGVVYRTIRYEVYEQVSFVVSDKLIESIEIRAAALATPADETVDEIVSTVT